MRFLRSLRGLGFDNEGFVTTRSPDAEVPEGIDEAIVSGGDITTIVKRLIRSFDETEFKLDKILNNGIDFGDNVDGGFVEVITNGDEQEVQHGLGHAPIGFFIISKDGAGDVYSTRVKEWTNDSLFLKSSVPNLTVRLFVL